MHVQMRLRRLLRPLTRDLMLCCHSAPRLHSIRLVQCLHSDSLTPATWLVTGSSPHPKGAGATSGWMQASPLYDRDSHVVAVPLMQGPAGQPGVQGATPTGGVTKIETGATPQPHRRPRRGRGAGRRPGRRPDAGRVRKGRSRNTNERLAMGLAAAMDCVLQRHCPCSCDACRCRGLAQRGNGAREAFRRTRGLVSKDYQEWTAAKTGVVGAARKCAS